MVNNTLFCGIALIVIGLFSYLIDAPGDMVEKAQKEKVAAIEKAAAEKGEPKPELDWKTVKLDDPRSEPITPGKVSMTALIPAAIGAVLVVLVVLVIAKPGLRKHAMHAGAAVGLIGALGGLYPLVKKLSGGVGLSWEDSGVRSGVLTCLVSAVYVGLAVKSFIDARKAREAGTPAAQ
ncbi:MAG: hypothetical protein MUF18_16640 [Fimbriiglobus sp.]|jgi:hypothetical protein|nr:hypothetical protein [Fimbriiglobus sp.]